MSTPAARSGPGVRTAAVSIVVAAAALRLWNIGAGIPYAVGPDEPHVMNRVAHMMKTGDFNPHFFDWPSLTFYLNLAVSCLAFLAGAMRGAWNHLDQVSAAELYLAGRQFTALAGAATVALTFVAARRWGSPVALVAAGLMAVIPGHVRESHFVLTDVPTALFTTLALWMALRAHERQTWASFLWAGAAVGLAASCKYNGSVAIVMPLVVVLGSGGGVALMTQRTLLVLASMLAGFLAGTPYAVLDLPAFLNDYARLAANFARERGGDPGWWIYMKHVSSNLAWPAFVAALAGLVLAARQGVTGPDRVRAWMIVAFAAVYFTVMARSFQIYGRYMLPLYPVLSICAGIGVMAVVRLLPRLRVARDVQAAGLWRHHRVRAGHAGRERHRIQPADREAIDGRSGVSLDSRECGARFQGDRRGRGDATAAAIPERTGAHAAHAFARRVPAGRRAVPCGRLRRFPGDARRSEREPRGVRVVS